MCVCACMHQLLFINRFYGRLGPKTILHYKNRQKGKLTIRKTSKQKRYIQALFSPIMWRKHSTCLPRTSLSVQMFSFPHKFAPDRKFIFKIKKKHKPRKAKKFKFRADTATSVTPWKLPHRLKGPVCRTLLKGNGMVWADPRHRFWVCSTDIQVRAVLWAALASSDSHTGRGFVTHTNTCLPVIWASVTWTLNWQHCQTVGSPWLGLGEEYVQVNGEATQEGYLDFLIWIQIPAKTI